MVNIKLVILVSVLVSLLLPIVMAQTYSNNINSNNVISSDTETKTNTDVTNTQNTDVKEDTNRINRWLRTGIKITYINEGREINFVNTTPNRTINRTPPIPPRNVTPNRTINRTPPIPPRNVTPNQCDDGVDNDRDGLIDYPRDKGCYFTLDKFEYANCSDSIDNDLDRYIDYPNDTQCFGPDDHDEKR